MWRGDFRNEELNSLHAEAFGHAVLADDWRAQLAGTAWAGRWRAPADLAGFVNAIWDGGTPAFILDTMVAGAQRRLGVGTRLVGVAAGQARAAGCEWLHVDFTDELTSFYFSSCGFRPTPAGLIAL